jgi:hypothetical protein
MSSIKRIVVTGDILRVSASGDGSQNVNIRWLHHLVGQALGMLTELPLQPLLHQRIAGNLAYELYRSNGLEMWQRNWVDLYERRPSTDDLACIGQAFESSLVLSFELPEILRNGLAILGIPYIDLTIHPVRFLDDVPFGIRSNIADLGSSMHAWVLTEDDIRIGAGLAMATLVRMPPPPECSQAEDWALFACQTEDDKVLIRDSRLMQASDFLESFAAMAARHKRILVKPHPVARTSPIKLLKRLFSNIVEVNANFYHLLAQDGISDVYSITSSTSIEAPYFGKGGTHFARYPYVFAQDGLTDVEYLQIRPAIHLPQFWAPLLSRVGIASRTPPPVDTTLWPNRMRRSLRNAWGADIFMGSH